MSDFSIVDKSQVISGVAVLISFFVGYKYATKKMPKIKDQTRTPNADVMQQQHVFFSNDGDYKMVLVVRNDLKMGKGKIGSQCGHGAVGAYQRAVRTQPGLVRAWENSGCAKIALKVESEHELMFIERKAKASNLNTCLIHDAGRTQIACNSKTVLAIGPAPVAEIDKVTGHLKLL